MTNTTIIFIKVITTASSNRLSQIKINDQQEITCTAHLTAAPEKGKANASLIKLLSKTLNIKKGNIEILRGHTSNKKILSIANISPEALRIVINYKSNPNPALFAVRGNPTQA